MARQRTCSADAAEAIIELRLACEALAGNRAKPLSWRKPKAGREYRAASVKRSTYVGVVKPRSHAQQLNNELLP